MREHEKHESCATRNTVLTSGNPEQVNEHHIFGRSEEKMAYKPYMV